MNIAMISTALLAVFALGVGNLDARGLGGGGHSGGDHHFSRSHHFGGMSHMGSHSNHQPAHSASHHPDSALQKANAGKTQQKAKKKKGMGQQQHPKARNAIKNHSNAVNRAKNAVHPHKTSATHRRNNHGGNLDNDHFNTNPLNDRPNWNGNGWNSAAVGAGLATGALAMGAIENAAMMGAAAGSASNAGFIGTPEIIAVPQTTVLGESVMEEVAPVREYHIEHDGAASADKQSPKHHTHYDDETEASTEDEYEEYDSDQKISKNNQNTDVTNTIPPVNMMPPVVINHITLGQTPSMLPKPPSMLPKLTADMISTAEYSSLHNTLSQADAGKQKTSAAP